MFVLCCCCVNGDDRHVGCDVGCDVDDGIGDCGGVLGMHLSKFMDAVVPAPH